MKQVDRRPPAGLRRTAPPDERPPASALERAKTLLNRVLLRGALFLAGCAVLAVAVAINVDAGASIIAGLFSPETPAAIVVSVARLLPPVTGLWLIYLALR